MYTIYVFGSVFGSVVGSVVGKKMHFLQQRNRICHRSWQRSWQCIWQKMYHIQLVEGPNLVSIVVDFLREDLLPFSVEFMEI